MKDMVCKGAKYVVGLIVIVNTFLGCGVHPERSPLENADKTNFTDRLPSNGEDHSASRKLLDELTPEILRNRIVEHAIQDGLKNSKDKKVQAWRDFTIHWPKATPHLGFGWSEHLQEFQGGVDATGVVQNRYTFQVVLDCVVSKDFKDIAFTRIRFNLCEVSSIDSNGVVYFETSSERVLNLDEFEHLKQSGWNFSSVGIDLISNAPVSGIDQAFP